MVECKIYSYFDYTKIEKTVMHFYKNYEVIDIKFSTAMDVKFNRVNYNVMIVYKEK